MGRENLHRKYRRHSGKCIYCNKQTFMFRPYHFINHPKRASLEHLIPKSRYKHFCEGFRTAQPNTVLACQQCNGLRRNTRLGEFLKRFPNDVASDIIDRIQSSYGFSNKELVRILNG